MRNQRGVVVGELIQIHVLERKDKQREGREVYLGLLPGSTVIRKGEEVRADQVQADDIIWFRDEPLKVVGVRPWPSEREEQDGRN